MAKTRGPVMLALAKILPRYDPPRREDLEGLTEWTESVRNNGLLTPLLVRPVGEDTYRLLVADREWYAARLARLSEVPAIIWDITEEEQADLALAEVLARWDALQE